MATLLRPTTTSIGQALLEAGRALREAGVASAPLDAELLLADALGVRRETLHAHPERVLSEDEAGRYRRQVLRRRAREPLAYITGHREFWSLEFDIAPGVLIPRPETEHLVEQFLEFATARPAGRPLEALDLGTGPGTLAVTLARECPGSVWQAVDCSPEALRVAAGNAQKHGVAGRIRFIAGDLLSPWQFLEESERFDAIVSNPPYIPSAALDGLMPEVSRFEPRLALDGGADGLDFYRCIAANAPGRLNPGGILLLEVGDGQSVAVTGELEGSGAWREIRTIPDYSGRNRVVSARRKEQHG